ncbi:HvfC/BufC N-terminal domain-containing protein [Immundisolibacter sp.]
MTALADFQRALASHVLTGQAPPAGQIVDADPFPAARRLAVYHSAYRLRLVEALGTDFPLLRGLLGDAGFERLTADYIAAHPSRSFTLRDFGHALPDFLARHGHYHRRPWLRATAVFEWALLAAFDAADTPFLTMTDLARVPPAQFPRLRFRFAPGVQVLRLRWNVPQAWRAMQEGVAPVPPPRLPVPLDCLVWRREERVYFRSLPADEAALLRALMKGRSFAAACGALGRLSGQSEVGRQAAQLIATWLADTLLVAQ